MLPSRSRSCPFPCPSRAAFLGIPVGGSALALTSVCIFPQLLTFLKGRTYPCSKHVFLAGQLSVDSLWIRDF